MSALPLGWAEASLDQLTRPDSPIGYGVLKPGDRDPAGVPMLRVTDIRLNFVDSSRVLLITPELDEEFRRSRLWEGDVLVSVQGTVGRVAIVPAAYNRSNISRTLARIRPLEETLSPWIRVALLAPQGQSRMLDQVGGSTRDSLNIGDLRQIVVPLPPLAEQRRIVAKIEALTARSECARTELTRVRELAEAAKFAVLDELLVGECTEELGRCALDVSYGYTASASRTVQGPKFLRITDLQDGQIAWDDVPRVPDAASITKRYSVEPDDLLFARTGATVGKSHLVTAVPEPTVFASYLIRARLNPNRVLPAFAAFFFQSGAYWRQITQGAAGTGQPNFNGSKLKLLRIPVPSLQEQRAIVARIEAAFTRIDAVVAEAVRAAGVLERLEQAVLAQAFRGELVSQDPADEAADALLARLAAARPAGPQRRGRRAAA